VNRWNDEFSKKKNPPPLFLDPSLVKAIAYQESRLGYGANTVGYPAHPDIMQVGDDRNPAIHTLRAEKGFEEYEWDDARNIPVLLKFNERVQINTPRDSIYWGVRWLYHKAQYSQKGKRNWKTWDEAVENYHKKGDLRYRDAVMKIYRKGIDRQGVKLWVSALIMGILISGVLGVSALSSVNRMAVDESDVVISMLKNATYVIDKKIIKLSVGFHSFHSALTDEERDRINPYDEQRGPHYVRYENGVRGDLNSDDIDDGVAVLGVNYGGTGQYINLAAVLFSADGTSQHVATYAFEDRDAVQAISIRDGMIEVATVVHGVDDPLCCPSRYMKKRLTLSDFTTTDFPRHVESQ
jgi:hypothetical protein